MCTEQDMWIKVPNHSQTRKAMQFIPWLNTEIQVQNYLVSYDIRKIKLVFSLPFMSIYNTGCLKQIFLFDQRKLVWKLLWLVRK